MKYGITALVTAALLMVASPVSAWGPSYYMGAGGYNAGGYGGWSGHRYVSEPACPWCQTSSTYYPTYPSYGYYQQPMQYGWGYGYPQYGYGARAYAASPYYGGWYW